MKNAEKSKCCKREKGMKKAGGFRRSDGEKSMKKAGRCRRSDGKNPLRHKKKLKFLVWTCLCLVLVLSVRVYGEESVTLPEEYGEFLDSLPEEVADSLPEGIYSQSPEEVADAVEQMSGVEYILSVLGSSVFRGLGRVLPHVCLLLGLVLASAVGSLLYSHLSPSGVRVFESVSHIVLFCSVGGVAVSTLSSVKEFFSDLCGIIGVFIPLSASVYTMGGNVGAAAKSGTGLLATLGIVELVSSAVVVPLFCFCLCLSLCAGLSPEFVGGGLGASVKKVFMSALALIITLLSVSLSSQSLIAAKADNVAMRSARIILGGVPVSGGFVASSLGTVASSVELIRGVVGVGGIVVLAALLLPELVALWLIKTAYTLLSSVCGVLGLPCEQRLFSEVSEAYGILEGVCVMCTLVFVIAMAVLCRTPPAVG